MLMCIECEHCLPLARTATAFALNEFSKALFHSFNTTLTIHHVEYHCMWQQGNTLASLFMTFSFEIGKLIHFMFLFKPKIDSYEHGLTSLSIHGHLR